MTFFSLIRNLRPKLTHKIGPSTCATAPRTAPTATTRTPGSAPPVTFSVTRLGKRVQFYLNTYTPLAYPGPILMNWSQINQIGRRASVLEQILSKRSFQSRKFIDYRWWRMQQGNNFPSWKCLAKITSALSKGFC
jgi:hypothetical protein